MPGNALFRCRPGLAGGLDRDGSRAAELLASGFASVEFGTVTPHPLAGDNPGVHALVARLAALGPRPAQGPAIGIALGNLAPSTVAGDWLAGFAAAAPHADYLSFNLSARTRGDLLVPARLPVLAAACRAVCEARRAGAHRPALALKLPLGTDPEPLPPAAEAALAAGFDGIVAVLSDAPERHARLARLASRLGAGRALVAVGGIRNAAAVSAARAAGAHGIQVHRAYAEHGRACLAPLLAGFATGS
jgi:dihydroorotate dehydrogenase